MICNQCGKEHEYLACIDKLEAEVARLRKDLNSYEERFERATVKVDGVDYRIEHFRANTTPDELRDIILGMAERLADIKTKCYQIVTETATRETKLATLANDDALAVARDYAASKLDEVAIAIRSLP